MEILKIFPKNARINDKGHLEIAGIDVCDLADEFGTPLFVYDEDDLRSRISAYRKAFEKHTIDYIVAYAGKAFLCLAMAKLVHEEGAYLDVVSGGELFTALSSGFPSEKIFFHGNNKTQDELKFALENDVGYIVLDSFNEIERLESLLKYYGKKQKVLIRVTPGIIPKTHTYIQTGQVDSKFGFSLVAGLAYEAVLEVLNSPVLELKGYHMHIGSQIFSTEPFRAAAVVMADFAAKVKKRTGYEPEILNYGGGPGVAYRLVDEPPQIEDFVDALVTQTVEAFEEKGVSFGKIAVEPGRSIVGPAAFTLYRIGTLKEIPGVRFYVSVDGGMSDNLRPMLYGAIYEAFIATKMKQKPETRVTVAGKHCENGDILIRDVELPYPEVGDILVVPVTGAYGFAMANNYNLQPRPAVVFVNDGKARLVIKRESYEDLIRNQMI